MVEQAAIRDIADASVYEGNERWLWLQYCLSSLSFF